MAVDTVVHEHGTSIGSATITDLVMRERIVVQAIRTGSVRVRSNQIRGKGTGSRRLVSTFVDRHWSDWLPIYAWLIEHPEGLILVDTGETARTAEPDYFPAWHPYYRRGVQFQVAPEEEIGQQLLVRGVKPTDIDWVIMTHLHTDHAGGLHWFPHSEILAAREDHTLASGFTGRLRGFLPNRWPEWFSPTPIEFESTPSEPFPAGLPVTKAGDVVIVPTPGHTAAHISVIVRDGNLSYFIAGDTSYTERLMVDGLVDGISADEGVAGRTLDRVRELARQEPLVYLPSHDPESAIRLAARQTVFPSDLDPEPGVATPEPRTRSANRPS